MQSALGRLVSALQVQKVFKFINGKHSLRENPPGEMPPIPEESKVINSALLKACTICFSMDGLKRSVSVLYLVKYTLLAR